MSDEQRHHGGPTLAELDSVGLDASQVLDFSVNVNPYGPSPALVDAVRRTRFDQYGDPTGAGARRALAAHLDVDPDRIALGNGAAELLWTLGALLARPDSGPAVIIEPTFSEFGAAARARGGAIRQWRAVAETGFALDVDAIGRLVRESRAASVYLCTPNNPTGIATPMSAVISLARASSDTTWIIDQSFLSVSDAWADARVGCPDNVVLLRSLTKDHAIPGLRVGYAIAGRATIAAVEAARPPWTTSALARAAVVASCELDDFIADCRERLRVDRGYLCQRLTELGIDHTDSSAPFVLAPLPRVAALRARLLQAHRVLIRDCASFGLPDYVRLAVRPRGDVDRLVAALARELER